MAAGKIITAFETKIYLELTEGEAGALDAICGYGPEAFLKWFKNNLGRYYIEKYEKHVKSLFEKAQKLEQAIHQAKKARAEIRDITV